MSLARKRTWVLPVIGTFGGAGLGFILMKYMKGAPVLSA